MANMQIKLTVAFGARSLSASRYALIREDTSVAAKYIFVLGTVPFILAWVYAGWGEPARRLMPPALPPWPGECLLYGGDVYSEEEACGWLTASGWRAVERKPLAGPVSLLVAETT